MREMLLRNSESIKLYRDIFRATKHFTWKNEAGEYWSNVLRQNARKEFEQARFEKDPEIIARLLFVGRDCLNQTNDRLMTTIKAMQNNIDSSKSN